MSGGCAAQFDARLRHVISDELRVLVFVSTSW